MRALRTILCSNTVCKRQESSAEYLYSADEFWTRLYVHDQMLCLDMQDHFTTAVNDAVSALNARHCMSRAIAAYTELHMSAYKQRKSAPGRQAVNKQQQEKKGSPPETKSTLSEQTTEVTEATSWASQISIAH